MRPRLPFLALTVLPLVACVGSAPEGDAEAYSACMAQQTQALLLEDAAPPTRSELVPIEAARVSEAVRAKMKEDARASLRVSRAGEIARVRCESLRPRPQSRGVAYAGASDESAGMGGSDAPPPNGDGASQVSGTNNQVAGVDEADFVKNDNKYIYVANGSRFRIIEAWPATTAHEIASVPIEGTVKKLFVHADRAVVYSSPVPSSQSGRGYYGRGSGECTYGYSCSFGGDGSPTTISIFDITDRANPVLLRTYASSSSLVAARRIGNAIHTVLAEGQPFSGVQGSYSGGRTEEEIRRAYDEQLAHVDADIDARPIEVLIPSLTTDAGPPPQHLFASTAPGGAAFTSVLSIDLAGAEANMVSILSSPGAVYASAESLYMAVPQQQFGGYYYSSYGNPATELSTIHKFSIGESPLATAYRGSGAVKGHVLSQFAMDEKDGKLRIATTAGQLPQPGVHSAVTVLEDRGGYLEQIGIVDNIAPSEDIRSVRFDGDRGYIVTFKKTDPLYVLDLANPTAPAILGELKIPGFSTYMHMMDPTHLLTIGYDADDQGSFAYFQGVLLQIFDVSNPTAPTLAHKEVIGTRGSSSEALTNHLAFTYFAPKNLLALPMTVCEGGEGSGTYGDNMTFSGLMVYDVTAQTGFALRGKVPHPRGENATCSNWWTDASSDVRRSIVMDDYVFSVSGRRIKVDHLNALGQSVAEIPIE